MTLFGVTTCLPRLSAFSTRARAPEPRVRSTSTSRSERATSASGSPVTIVRAKAGSSGFSRSISATATMSSRRPLRAAICARRSSTSLTNDAATRPAPRMPIRTGRASAFERRRHGGRRLHRHVAQDDVDLIGVDEKRVVAVGRAHLGVADVATQMVQDIGALVHLGGRIEIVRADPDHAHRTGGAVQARSPDRRGPGSRRADPWRG